jgi:C4-dicarboxylate-specific signal transduction histidine kinase
MSVPENREAAFLAKITASATHEIRNVLAIVKESAGLIQDVIHSWSQSEVPNQDKVLRSLGRIDAQVTRGADLLSNLNRFAHSLDRVQEETDLSLEAQQVALLSQRFARKKRHLVQVRSADQRLPVAVKPLELQMALFAAVECCLDQLPEASTVTIHPAREGDRASVEFIGEAGEEALLPAPSAADGWGRLVELLDDFGASIETSDTAYRFRIVLPLVEAR